MSANAESQKMATASLWLSLPAVLAILLGIFFLFAMVLWNPEKIRTRYEETAVSALAEKDYPTALVAAQRLLGFGSEKRNEAIFLIAKSKLGLGRTGDAAGLLEMIAPYDKPVYAPAHLLVARNLIDRPDPDVRTDQATIAQLKNVLALEPDSVEAKALLANLSLKKKNWLEARKYLEEIVSSKPEAMFQLIDIARALGDERDATAWKTKALTHYRAKFEDPKSSSAADRVFYCEALLQSGEFDSALRVLASAPESENDAAAERRIQVVYRAWSDALTPVEPDVFLQRVKDLALEVASGPNRHLANVLIASAANDYPGDPSVQAIQRQIQDAGSDRSGVTPEKVKH
jgi:tetratricopeptide (TPR) repeat protein